MFDVLSKGAALLPFQRRQSWRKWLRLGIILIVLSFLLFQVGPSTSYAAPRAINWPLVRLQLVANNFASPIGLVSAYDGANRLFVIERGGRIQIIENGARLATPFLDISDRVPELSACEECGLLGLAFPPDFAEAGYFFVNYTTRISRIPGDTGDPDGSYDTVIARFNLSNNPNVADAASEDPILVINQPYANHNGGQILFGPDDYLYIGMGDGGGSGDVLQNAQNPASLHGKMLRIAVSATGTYTVPATNPFINMQGYRPEIWAMGLRNPWRFSFDRITGDLYIADVGQGAIEEVNHVANGQLSAGGMNFGWPIMEGNVCYPPNGSQECDRTGLTLPIVTYDHSLGDCAVTGGYVYRSALPNQAPIYLYGDFCSGRLWGLQLDDAVWAYTQISSLGFQITSFGEDEAGNVYVVSYSGNIYRLRDPLNAKYLPGLSKHE